MFVDICQILKNDTHLYVNEKYILSIEPCGIDKYGKEQSRVRMLGGDSYIVTANYKRVFRNIEQQILNG